MSPLGPFQGLARGTGLRGDPSSSSSSSSGAAEPGAPAESPGPAGALPGPGTLGGEPGTCGAGKSPGCGRGQASLPGSDPSPEGDCVGGRPSRSTRRAASVPAAFRASRLPCPLFPPRGFTSADRKWFSPAHPCLSREAGCPCTGQGPSTHHTPT